MSISPASFILLSNSSLTVAFAHSGLVYQIRNAADTSALSTVDMSSCASGSQCGVATLRFQENFATASKIKLQGSAQNVPGAVYNSESGFFDPNWATTNPSIAGAGAADFATRFKADFHGIPAGAQLWVAVADGSSRSTLTASEGGPLSPISATTVIGGFPAAQLTATNGAATAIWEVTGPNPAQVDTFDFPVWVVFPAQSTPSGILTINEALAPDPDDGAFNINDGSSAQNSSFPVPRFTSIVPSGMAISPNSGINTGQVLVSLTTRSGVSQDKPCVSGVEERRASGYRRGPDVSDTSSVKPDYSSVVRSDRCPSGTARSCRHIPIRAADKDAIRLYHSLGMYATRILVARDIRGCRRLGPDCGVAAAILLRVDFGASIGFVDYIWFAGWEYDSEFFGGSEFERRFAHEHHVHCWLSAYPSRYDHTAWNVELHLQHQLVQHHIPRLRRRD